MYNASADFHRAVFEAGAEQRVLVKFTDNTIFTNEDIAISQGIKVSEAVNPDEELTIGSAPSAEFTATIINDKGLLNGYAYGEADVLLGVRTASYAADLDRPTAILRYGGESPVVFTGSATMPYLTVNGYTPAEQPPFGVGAILINGVTVYCISENGEPWAAGWVDDSSVPDIGGYLVPINDPTEWQDLATQTWEDISDRTWGSFAPWFEINAFMTDKATRWAKENKGFWFNSNILYEFGETAVDKYEYVPLGKFIIDTPAKRKINLVAISAFDRMSRFDVDATEFWSGIEYPTTIGDIFAGLCEFVGVPRATLTFINSTRSFAEAPATYDAITAREILKWVAEAACSYARMTRDGEVELVWFGTEAVSIPMTQYFSIDAAEYNVPQINKLQVMSAENDIGVIIGTGTNGYQIVDNPMLYGATDAQIRAYATPIYNRLASFDAFSPISANAVCDWSVQAGDIIEIIIDDVTYVLPVYNQTITWTGGAKAVYESTGSAARPVMDAVNRQVFSQKRAMNELVVDVNGISSRLTSAEGEIASLEFNTSGLALAIGANKLTFDASGLTVYGGGLKIKNNSNTDVLYADTSGNLTLKGKLSGVSGTFTNLTGTGYVQCVDSTFDGESVTLVTSKGTVNIGAYSGYSQVSIFPSGNNTGNIGGTSNYWDLGCFNRAYINIISTSPTFDGTAIFPSMPTTTDTGDPMVRIGSSTNRLLKWGSSRRFKENISDLPEEYTSLSLKLRPVTFNAKDSGRLNLGLIAEEVEDACRLLCTYELDKNGERRVFGVSYELISVLNVSLLKQHEARIAALEKMIKERSA